MTRTGNGAADSGENPRPTVKVWMGEGKMRFVAYSSQTNGEFLVNHEYSLKVFVLTDVYLHMQRKPRLAKKDGAFLFSGLC